MIDLFAALCRITSRERSLSPPRESRIVTMKHSVFLRLCVLLLLTALLLTSCGIVIWHGAPCDTDPSSPHTDPVTDAVTEPSDPAPSETSPAKHEPVERAEGWLNSLPDYDFDGLPVILADLGQTTFVPSDTADVLSLSAYTRNRMVEKKYHTTILEVRSSSAEALIEEAKASSKAGSYYADMLLLPAEALAPMMQADMLMNLNSLPFLNLDRPYFNADAVAQFTAGGRTFALAGTLTEDPQSLYACFFNRNLLASITEASLYSAVAEGNWTLDTLLSLLPLLPEGKQGVTCYEGQDALLRSLFLASGQHFTETGNNALPAPAFAGERTDRFVEAMRALFACERGYDSRSGYDSLLGFYTGEDLFFIAPFYVSEWIVDMNDSWGVLPLPKTDDAQESYYSCTAGSANIAAVLRGTANVERLGIFIEAIFAAAGDQQNAYLLYYTDRCLRDSRSIDMLECIIGSVRLDLTCLLGDAYPTMTDASVAVLADAVYRGKSVTEKYGNQLSRLRRQMERLFPTYG